MELERLNERAHRYNQRVVPMRAPYQKPTRLAIVSDEDGEVLKDDLTVEDVRKWYDALDAETKEAIVFSFDVISNHDGTFSIKLTNTKTDDVLTFDELPDADFANWLAEFASKVVKYANEVAQHFKVSEAAKDFIPLSKTTD